MFNSYYQINGNISLRKIDMEYVPSITNLRKKNKSYLPFLTWMENQSFTNYETAIYVKNKLSLWSENKEWTFAIFYKEKLIGDFQIRKYNYENEHKNEIELGYWLDYKYRLKGIMSSIIEFICNLSIELKITKIIIVTDKSNVASINLALKLGFTKNDSLDHGYSDNSLIAFEKNI